MATKPKKRVALSAQQEEKKSKGRELSVVKANDMIQKGRHQLTKQEQRAVLFAISKIKPTDKVFEEYVFELSELYAICGLQKESYNEMKAILNGLADRGWDIPMKDNPDVMTRVRWFGTLRTNKKSGRVSIKFHEDMMPYLLELSERDEFYTGYSLRYVLPMDSQYGPRLYEILKSYQKNNSSWFFEVQQLKALLGADNYKNFADFQKRVLDPAVKDINDYSDLNVMYIAEKEGVRYSRVTFHFYSKKPKALEAVKMAGDKKLDGETDAKELCEKLANDEDYQKLKSFREANMKSE